MMKNIMKTAAVLAAFLMLTSCGISADHKTTAETVTNPAAAAPTDSSEYIYCIASVSKVYVTAAVMQLADAGKLDIEKPVTEYIPDFRMADARYKDITVRMLMDHTSGIMGTTWTNAILYNDNDQIGYHHLLAYLSAQRLKADPGSYASYCNDGFMLLERIVENVSGMTFTEYIKTNISDKLGLEHTGTAIDLLGSEQIVPSVSADNIRYDTAYDMGIGTGGVYSSASDNARFGASFFKGNQTLLSEKAKTAMAAPSSYNAFREKSGLGWDYAGMKRYYENGVNVVGKGGDAELNHAWLWCAPDEQISVSVLTNGGSSTYNAMVAEALLDIALEEQGKPITEPAKAECTTVTQIPEEYSQYAGWYIVNVMGGGDSLCHITFPDPKYMHIEETTHRKTTCTDYLLTTDGDFAELAYEVEESGFDPRLAAGYSSLSFEQTADGTFLRMQDDITYPGIGRYDVSLYTGQKIEENPVSSDVINAYKEMENKALLLCGEKYTSTNYNSMGISQIYVIDKLSGYVFINTHEMDTILKMTDQEHLKSFKNIPSSSSRDQRDLTLLRDENGVKAIESSCALSYLSEDRVPLFDASVKTVQIGDDAAWFRISDSIANKSVTVTRPENGAVYVYNKYGEVIYTSHNQDAKPQIPMPKGGKVLFLGETGSQFNVRL